MYYPFVIFTNKCLIIADQDGRLTTCRISSAFTIVRSYATFNPLQWGLGIPGLPRLTDRHEYTGFNPLQWGLGIPGDAITADLLLDYLFQSPSMGLRYSRLPPGETPKPPSTFQSPSMGLRYSRRDLFRSNRWS